MRTAAIVLVLAGCAVDGEQPEPSPTEEAEEECSRGVEMIETLCPWAWSISTGSDSVPDDPHLVELEDVAEPVCNGMGLFAEPDDFGDAPLGPRVTIVRNSHCAIVCYPQCGFTNACYAKNPSGQACGHACAPMDDMSEAECEAFVAECIGDPAACE
ncbi:hypothetical protein [Paraliomyxa miuraensis]|uniref:hypothetical protein n=1 Tax=Paraliomyxa miuraensis TaxID=376150 RepID=UPI0022548D92|nr:hypothetical protein [Paraliomyxa miuraensis]MCX4242524.1 hypothetical protein [Paraliomyxa miuraensis]